MQYEIFRKYFLSKQIIEVREVRLVFPKFDSRRLFEWQRKGYIQKIINGYYMFADIERDEFFLMRVANVIYAHSYVSLETALRYYGLIPEAVYQITSCSTRKTKIFNTQVASFSYRSFSPACFFGYVVENHDHGIFIATPEKAVLDYLYFRTQFDEDDFYEWRLNLAEYKNRISEETMEKYLHQFQSNALSQRYVLLREFLNNA